MPREAVVRKPPSLQAVAAEMAKDEEVIRSVAESLEAIKRGETLSFDEAFACTKKHSE